MIEHKKSWTQTIGRSLEHEKSWREKSQKIFKAYCASDENDKMGAHTAYNILFSNTETLLPAIFQQMPSPDIRKRYADTDSVASVIAEVLQKATAAIIDSTSLTTDIEETIQDGLLAGRGILRLRYGAVFKEGSDKDDKDFAEKLIDEVIPERVHFEDFTCEQQRTWSRVNWIAFRHCLSKKQIEVSFPDAAPKLGENGYKHDITSSKESLDDVVQQNKYALVWEIWDKTTRQIHWVCPDMQSGEILRTDEDVLKLKGFFPCPEPLRFVRRTDTVLPVPEYQIYENLAIELNQVSKRITKLVDALRVRGVYADIDHSSPASGHSSGTGTLARVLSASDNEMVPAGGLHQEGRLQDRLFFVPLEPVIQALERLYEARSSVLQSIYEVTGISDILRGTSDPGDSATAQRIKGNFGTLRLDRRRRSVANYLKQIIEIIVEIVAKHFDADSLAMITGEEIDEVVQSIISMDGPRLTMVNVETDSTIAVDQQVEQETAAGLSETVIGSITHLAQMVQAGMLQPEMAATVFKLAIKPFKGTHDIESQALEIFKPLGMEELPPDEMQNEMIEQPVPASEPVF